MNFTPSNGNATVCPSGDGTLEFGSSEGGLEFVYTNASGFVAHGDCDLAGFPQPKTTAFECSYTADGGSLGKGSGTGRVVFVPRLRANIPLFLVAISGGEAYPSRGCGYSIAGSGVLIGNAGSWKAPSQQLSGCPHTPMEEVAFEPTQTTIRITAPGLSNASCRPTSGPRVLEVTPSSLDFGSESVGSTASKTLTIKSTLPVPIPSSSITFLVDSPFNTDKSACPAFLDPGATCSVKVTFAPTTKGKTDDDMVVIASGVDQASFQLTGVGK